MPTYLYCLLRAGAEVPPGLQGVDGAAVRALAVADATAWVSTVAAAQPPSVAAIRAHDEVSAAALERGTTPLPARFGQLFETDSRCISELESRAGWISRTLARLEGHVEMTVLMRLATPATLPVSAEAGAGHAYLGQLRQRMDVERNLRQSAESLRQKVAGAVGGLARSEAVRLDSGPVWLLSISHLIARGDVDHYRTALESLEIPAPISQPVIAGPTPPYRFVAAEDGE